MPQPNFGHPDNTGQVGFAGAAGPFVPTQGTDWNQTLQQGYQSRHRVDQHIPIAGPSAPIAGPSRPVQDRVDWNSRFQQGFQARQNQ